MAKWLIHSYRPLMLIHDSTLHELTRELKEKRLDPDALDECRQIKLHQNKGNSWACLELQEEERNQMKVIRADANGDFLVKMILFSPIRLLRCLRTVLKLTNLI